jgi:hypothetical protein
LVRAGVAWFKFHECALSTVWICPACTGPK